MGGVSRHVAAVGEIPPALGVPQEGDGVGGAAAAMGRPGEKGPLAVETVKGRVQAKTDRRRTGPEETLVVFRERQPDGSFKHDYCLCNAAVDTPLAEFARVANAEHRIEECLKRAKSEAGLSDYEVRTWKGWHHHQTLSLMATWFLTQEARRGKKKNSRDYSSADSLWHCPAAA